MERSEIITAVNDLLVNEFELEAGDLKPETGLREDLQLDSLDAVDLVVALDKRFKIRIPEDKARGVKTLDDIYGYLEAELSKNGGS